MQRSAHERRHFAGVPSTSKTATSNSPKRVGNAAWASNVDGSTGCAIGYPRLEGSEVECNPHFRRLGGFCLAVRAGHSRGALMQYGDRAATALRPLTRTVDQEHDRPGARLARSCTGRGGPWRALDQRQSTRPDVFAPLIGGLRHVSRLTASAMPPNPAPRPRYQPGPLDDHDDCPTRSTSSAYSPPGRWSNSKLPRSSRLAPTTVPSWLPAAPRDRPASRAALRAARTRPIKVPGPDPGPTVTVTSSASNTRVAVSAAPRRPPYARPGAGREQRGHHAPRALDERLRHDGRRRAESAQHLQLGAALVALAGVCRDPMRVRRSRAGRAGIRPACAHRGSRNDTASAGRQLRAATSSGSGWLQMTPACSLK